MCRPVTKHLKVRLLQQNVEKVKGCEYLLKVLYTTDVKCLKIQVTEQWRQAELQWLVVNRVIKRWKGQIKTNGELGQSPWVQYTFTESHSRLLVVGVIQWPAFTLSGNVLVGCTMNNCWTGNSGSDYAQSIPTENTNVKLWMKKKESFWTTSGGKSGKRPDSTVLKESVWLNKEVFNKVYKLAGDWWKLSVREGWVN